jgi:hypothetical protein
MKYAQELFGQRLHLVDEINGKTMRQALCGRVAESGWRATFNLPLGMSCRNCVRVYQAKRPTPRRYVVVGDALAPVRSQASG